MKKAAFYVVAYLTCAFIAWGLTLGDFTNQFPERDNRESAFVMAVLGPGGIIADLDSFKSPHHFRVIPLSREQRMRIFFTKWPDMTEKSFK